MVMAHTFIDQMKAPPPPMFLLNYGSIKGKVYILLQLKKDGTLQAEYG